MRPPEPLSPSPRPGKTARNERRKLEAQTLNAVGLGVVAVGGIQTVFAGHLSWALSIRVAISLGITYLLHRAAIALLGRLEE